MATVTQVPVGIVVTAVDIDQRTRFPAPSLRSFAGARFHCRFATYETREHEAPKEPARIFFDLIN